MPLVAGLDDQEALLRGVRSTNTHIYMCACTPVCLSLLQNCHPEQGKYDRKRKACEILDFQKDFIYLFLERREGREREREGRKH